MKLFSLILVLTALITNSKAHAYYSLMDTTDILAGEQYTFTTEGQWVTSGERGLNLRGHFDQGLNDSSQMRFTFGTGVNTLQGGFFYKWVPVPDFGKQPGFGIVYGAMYSKIDKDSSLGIRLKFISSKKTYLKDDSLLKPYGGVMTGVSVTSKKDLFPLQLVVGTQYQPKEWKTLFLMAEAAWGSSEAFSYLSFGLQWDFNEASLEKVNKNSVFSL